MINVQANRASALFHQAATAVNHVLPTDIEYPNFSHWCRFYGENPDEQDDSIKLIDSRHYNRLENKLQVNQLLNEHGIKDVFPATFTCIENAVAYSIPGSIWFVKPSHLSGGRGIQVITHEELANFDLPRHNIIQAGVENIELIDGKKYTARVYVLLWNHKAYLFNDGFAMIHAPRYQRGSTEYGIQVDHRGYQTGDSGVAMSLYSEVSSFSTTMPKAKAALKRLLPILETTLKVTSPKRYLLLGIDLLPLEDGTVKFIEINAMPNFVHSQYINQALNVPFFEHTLRTIYGLGSERFWPIAESASSRVFVVKRPLKKASIKL